MSVGFSRWFFTGDAPTCRFKEVTSSIRSRKGLPRERVRLPLQETQVRSLGGEAPLEEGTATHSSVLAWRSPWTEEPGGLQSLGSHRVDRTEHARVLEAETDSARAVRT